MKKERFLRVIQPLAKLTGSRAHAVWPIAVAIDPEDRRWHLVHYHADEDQVLRDFAAVFGVSLPEPPVRKRSRKAHSEILRDKIARAKDRLPHIARPDWRAQAEASIAALEEKLAWALKEEAK
jgi:hypothetical protein